MNELAPSGLELLVRYRNTDLYAVPSIHNDLVFADLVCRTLPWEKFDVIDLELPRDISPSALTAEVDRIWPAPGVAIVKGRDLGTRRFPMENRKRRVAATDILIPIVPGDSLIAAIHAHGELCKRMAGRIPVLEFCDLPIRSERGNESRRSSRLPDSWLVAKRGLDSYLEATQGRCEEGRLPIDDARERSMAATLKRHIDAGKRILFVCGMAHWQRITAMLDGGGLGVPVTIDSGSEFRPIEVFSMEAAEAWWLGWMGIPAILGDFVRKVETGGTCVFQMPAAITRLKEAALKQAGDVGGQSISIRACLAFERYLEGKLVLNRRWCPELDRDLCQAAKACVNDEFAKTLKDVALAYPYNPPASVPVAKPVRIEGQTYLVAGQVAYLVNRRDCTEVDVDAEPRTLPIQEAAPLSRMEELKAGLLPVIRSIPAEDALQKSCIHYAWAVGDFYSRLPQSTQEDMRTTAFAGDLGRGINWRRTIQNWADGGPEDTFSVKIATHRRGALTAPMTCATPEVKACPVVWMFAPEDSVSMRVAGHFPPVNVYASFYWLTSSIRKQARITREQVAYGVNVLRGRSSWDEPSVRKLLKGLPLSQQPRIEPWRDEELSGFTGSDLAVATGIKYAGNRVIVVADWHYLLGLKVQNYARNKGVELIRVPWDLFGSARRRLALQHTAPAKSSFVDPDEFILRQIPPVEEFHPHFPDNQK